MKYQTKRRSFWTEKGTKQLKALSLKGQKIHSLCKIIKQYPPLHSHLNQFFLSIIFHSSPPPSIQRMNTLLTTWSMKMTTICYIRLTVWMGLIKMVKILPINMTEIILLRLTRMMARYDIWLGNWWRWVDYIFIVFYLFYFRDYLVLNYFFWKRVLYLFWIFSKIVIFTITKSKSKFKIF